jgi:hypothetical protein
MCFPTVRTLLFSLLLLAFYPPLSAQISIGAHLGGGRADNSFFFQQDQRQSWEAKGVVAATAGLETTLNLNQQWAIQLELNADLRGNQRLGIRNQYLYLSIPLLLRYQWDFGQIFTPYVTSGAYAARLLGNRQGPGDRLFEDIFLPEFQEPRPFDFGLLAGVGGVIRLNSRWAITTECRGSWGLAKLYQYPLEQKKLSERRTNISLLLNTGLRHTLR